LSLARDNDLSAGRQVVGVSHTTRLCQLTRVKTGRCEHGGLEIDPCTGAIRQAVPPTGCPELVAA
jgi:hypothetical protein